MTEAGQREAGANLGERINELVREALASANKPLSLSEIEDIALQVRERIGAEVTQTLVRQQAPLTVPGPVCERCGKEMHYKGMKKRRMVTRSGEIDWERPYYYCAECRRGIFPPR
jgi:predicted Zn-ribbon and HTH transcriptional regulator